MSMNLDLKNKRVLITGSSRGIGFGIAEAFFQKQSIITLNGRDTKNLEAATKLMPGSFGIKGDVTCAKDSKRIVETAVRKMGGIDIVICNVGRGKSQPVGHETLDEWRRMLDVNFMATVNVVDAARSHLKSTRGVIVCVSSICGVEVIPTAPVTYSVAKSALNAFVRGMARPLGKDGIRICAVAPGNILFEGSVWSRKLHDDATSVKSMIDNDVSIGSLGEVQDIAEVVTFLSSSSAKFITGNIWVVDGGQVRH